MALFKKKEKVNSSAPLGPQSQDAAGNKKKMNGVLFGILAFFISLAIMLGILGGAFYVIIRNNINGLGEKYRPNIQAIPVLKLALPPVADPEDPKYLTPEEIMAKYQELRKLRSDLTVQLEEANKKIAELEGSVSEQDQALAEATGEKDRLEAQQAQVIADREQLEADRKELDAIIASGDKAGFKAYFEQVNSEAAKEIYTQIMQEQKVGEEEKKFAKLYEGMDAAAAAGIFEAMGTSKMDMVVNILKSMSSKASTQILAEMTPAFASQVTVKLKEQFVNSANSAGVR